MGHAKGALNAGFHQRPGNPTLPANIHILPLPAYSLELNPVEKFWKHLRDRIANVVYGTIEAPDSAVCCVLHDLAHPPTAIRSMVGEGWLYLQANSSSKNFSLNIF